MKAKTLKNTKTGEYVHILNINNLSRMFNNKYPNIYPVEASIEEIKEYHENLDFLYDNLDFTDIELIDIEIKEV
jgi:hypothetical protein